MFNKVKSWILALSFRGCEDWCSTAIVYTEWRICPLCSKIAKSYQPGPDYLVSLGGYYFSSFWSFFLHFLFRLTDSISVAVILLVRSSKFFILLTKCSVLTFCNFLISALISSCYVTLAIYIVEHPQYFYSGLHFWEIIYRVTTDGFAGLQSTNKSCWIFTMLYTGFFCSFKVLLFITIKEKVKGTRKKFHCKFVLLFMPSHSLPKIISEKVRFFFPIDLAEPEKKT